MAAPDKLLYLHGWFRIEISGQILQSTASVATGAGCADKLAFWTGTNSLGYNTLLHRDLTCIFRKR